MRFMPHRYGKRGVELLSVVQIRCPLRVVA